MNVLLATNLELLAQGYDDTGAASRLSIVIGALAFPCLIIIAVVWQKLKNAKENEKHIENLQKKVAELENTNAPKQSVATPPLQKEVKYRDYSNLSDKVASEDSKPQFHVGLTKEQKVYINEVFARAGKPSPELQRQIKEILAVKSEDELTKLFLRDSEVVRPANEAELLSVVLLAKKAELKSLSKN